MNNKCSITLIKRVYLTENSVNKVNDYQLNYHDKKIRQALRITYTGQLFQPY